MPRVVQTAFSQTPTYIFRVARFHHRLFKSTPEIIWRILSLFERIRAFFRTRQTESNAIQSANYPETALLTIGRLPADRATRFLLVATKHNRLNAQNGTLM